VSALCRLKAHQYSATEQPYSSSGFKAFSRLDGRVEEILSCFLKAGNKWQSLIQTQNVMQSECGKYVNIVQINTTNSILKGLLLVNIKTFIKH